ncbi:class A beta-lactamase-related serine hydrolase [Candidatus Parcubacteria bacterium]|nr:MAG: class A beta-lactamase-related serine hydrolase [Candidatus Parcubacteria bacterium]
MDELLISRTQQAIRERVFPGCIIGLIRANRRIVIPVGTTDGKNPVNENTVYDLASITKSIPLASLALTLMQENPPRLNLEGKVIEYLPELRNGHGATIEDLLRYRVKGSKMSELQFKTFEEIRTHVLEKGFDLPRRSLGEDGWGTYTNLPAFVLGLIIERVTGEILPALADKYFFKPLGMNDTTFFPENLDTSTLTGRSKLMLIDKWIAPTEIVDGQEIRGIVHDESARVFSRARRAVGHAGLFSTAPDLLKFLEAMIAGELPAVVDGAQKGLGWEIGREWMGSKGGKGVFGKTGFTGTSILCDPEKGIGLVILSNRTYPHRPPDNSAINLFRKDIAHIVLE